MSVRVRFAPSPTGPVHIGNIRVAIFNWLFARHAGGCFLLRVEDTDRERSTPEAVAAMRAAMDWLGLTIDEAPLYQSARRDVHLAAAERLLAEGRAYRQDKGGTGRGEAIVFRMPGTDIAFTDEVRGALRKAAADLPDFVIVRSDGTPVFHLGNVVDDIDMGITHVIRGDDHLENTFRHVALYAALGATPPRFAHLPMIVNAQGKPYSKRDGAAYVGDFREQGYLPDALFNFLALLGWSPGDDREVMTRDEMIAGFTLDRVQSSPARLDLKKMEWMNGEYLRRMPREAFAAGFRQALEQAGLAGVDADPGYWAQVLALMQPRTRLFRDAPADAGFYFTEAYPFDPEAARKRLWVAGVPEQLEALRTRLDALPAFTLETTEQALQATAEALGVEPKVLIHPLRVAVSGIAKGPGLYELLVALGRDRVRRRLDRAIGESRRGGGDR